MDAFAPELNEKEFISSLSKNITPTLTYTIIDLQNPKEWKIRRHQSLYDLRNYVDKNYREWNERLILGGCEHGTLNIFPIQRHTEDVISILNSKVDEIGYVFHSSNSHIYQDKDLKPTKAITSPKYGLSQKLPFDFNGKNYLSEIAIDGKSVRDIEETFNTLYSKAKAQVPISNSRLDKFFGKTKKRLMRNRNFRDSNVKKLFGSEPFVSRILSDFPNPVDQSRVSHRIMMYDFEPVKSIALENLEYVISKNKEKVDRERDYMLSLVGSPKSILNNIKRPQNLAELSGSVIALHIKNVLENYPNVHFDIRNSEYIYPGSTKDKVEHVGRFHSGQDVLISTVKDEHHMLDYLDWFLPNKRRSQDDYPDLLILRELPDAKHEPCYGA